MKVIGLHSFALFSLRALLREQHVTDRYKNKIENQELGALPIGITNVALKNRVRY